MPAPWRLLASADHPQDKDKAELSVQLVERWLLAGLCKQRFASVHGVIDAIAPLLTCQNERAFQKMVGCRACVFDQRDAAAWMALPVPPWERAAFKTVQVQMVSHVEFERHRDSAPHTVVGQVVKMRVTAHVVEVLHPRVRQLMPFFATFAPSPSI